MTRIMDLAKGDGPRFVIVSPFTVSRVYQSEADARADARMLAEAGRDAILAQVVAVFVAEKPK